jgi:WD40 repeat protein
MSLALAAPPCPYKGLTPFEDSDLDALLFFGRERESEVISANLIASRITILYGPSGVGKSSVLRAGVAHRLRQEREAEVIVFSTWTGDPVSALIEAAGGTGDSLADALADAADRAGGDLFLILDQFEECFLYHRGGGRFAVELAKVLRRGGLRVNVLIGMREDALARLDALKASIPNLLANRLRLERLDRLAGAAAINGPIARYNELVPAAERVEVEARLEQAVLDEVTAGRVDLRVAGRGVAIGAGDENRIEAPYLQLVLARLWDVERERGSRTLRLATLRELGGAEQIVEDHLEHAMAELSPREKGAAAAMYNFLVTPSGTKIAHGVRDLAGYASVDETEAAEVLRRLTAERIVRASSENGPTTTRYEIYHDVLADAVLAWRSRFESDRILAEERIDHRRRQRRLLAIFAVALAAFAVMSAVAVYALAQRSNAQHQASIADVQRVRAERAADKARRNEHQAKQATRYARRQAVVANRARRNARASEHKAKRSAALAEAERLTALSEKARAEGNERKAKLFAAQAVRAEQRATAQALLAKRQTRTAERAKALATQRGRVLLAAKLEAEAGLLLAVDAEKSVRRSLDAIRAYRTARIRPTVRVEDTLRDGILNLRLRAVLRLSRAGPVRVVRFSPDDAFAFVGAKGGAALYDLRHRYAARALLPSSDIADAAFSPDGTLVAGAGGGKNDRVVHVWDVRTGTPVLTLEHQGPVNTVAFSPSGQLIASGSDDGTARLWSVATGQQVASFSHDKTGARGDDVIHVSFSPDGTRLLTVGGNRFARVFDVLRRTELFALNNIALVNAARFSHNGRLIATAGASEFLRTWNAQTGAPVSVLDLTGRVADLAFSPNDSLVATAGSNDTVGRIWNLEKESAVATITEHRSGVESVVFTPDGQSLVTTGRDGKALVFGVAAGFRQASLAGHTGPVEGAEVSHDGRLIATWSEDGAARVWNARIGAYPRDVGKHDLPPGAKHGPVIGFSPDGRYMLSAGADGTAHLWGSRAPLRILSHAGPVNTASFSRNSKSVITSSDDWTARVWRVSDGHLIASLQHGAAVTAARLTPNGQFAVTAGRDGFVRVWNVATASRVRSYELGGTINDAELSHDGKFVVAASSNWSAAIFGIAADRELILKGHTDDVVAAAFSPDGKRVATASEDGTARIWDARTGTSSDPLTGHTAGLTALAFNKDGSRLATTGTDTDVRIWNGRTGAEIAVLRGHAGQVNDLAFSADGRWLASAGPLAAAIWETSKGRSWTDIPLYYVYGDPPPRIGTPRLDHVAFSPTGWRLLTSWRNGAVRLFNCSACGGIPQLQAIAKQRLSEIARPKRPT